MEVLNQRVFLDWQRPALLAAVDWLREHYAVDRAWDLGNLILVVPGRRAGRRLLELLVTSAQEHRLAFVPPGITTEGALPEKLYQPKFPFADKLTQELAWGQALQRLAPDQWACITPFAPATNDAEGWHELGRILRACHVELAADTHNFADVARLGAELPEFPDQARWLAMSAAQQAYHALLDELQLWDVQTARLEAIRRREIHSDRQVVLLGTVDLNRTLRAVLRQLGDRVIALVAAPYTLADRFDALGCLLPDAWLEAELPLTAEQVTRVDGPAEQAEAVANILASYAGKYRGDEITIGVPDERIVRHVRRQLDQCSVPTRWVEGKLLPETAPYLLLAAVADFLGSQSASDFAALVRHADIYEWLTRNAESERISPVFLEELDRLVANHLVTRVNPASWPPQAKKIHTEGKDFTQVASAVERVRSWLSPLDAQPQRLGEWSAVILRTLRVLYGNGSRELNRDTFAALEKLRAICQEQTTIPSSLQPRLSSAEAIHWSLSQLASTAIPPPGDEEAVELLGWLELPLDDAPALVVTTFNEGFVPESTSADPFLPNALRKKLGLLDNDRRYARDAYNLCTLCHSRANVSFITARRDPEENRLVPSRLLFAALPEEVVRRARAFFHALPESPRREPLVGLGFSTPAKSRLFVPRPSKALEAFEKIRVTQFRDYLACPYRFYLKHVLKLESAEESPEELQGGAFGDLAHSVLEAFGKAVEINTSPDSEDIFAYLREQLQLRTKYMFGGEDRLAAVEIQLEQLQARLRKFAQWQAKHTENGWRIVLSEDTDDPERKSEPEAMFEVDGRPIRLRGRIDRIDRHEGTGELLIFDYKTGDAGDKPERVHRSQGAWIDLQLPLYRHLAKAWGHSGDVVRLGYILLPKSLEAVGDAIADWSEAELNEADETARQVIRNIRAGLFWPPNEPPKYADEFTGICQDRRLGGRDLGDEESREEGE